MSGLMDRFCSELLCSLFCSDLFLVFCSVLHFSLLFALHPISLLFTLLPARIPLHLALSRTLKESTAAAQHFTSRLLLQHPHCRSALNSFTAQPAEEDHHLIDLFWPGKQTPMRATLTVRMLPGWNDTRLVSKRCILLQEPAVDAARAVTSRSSHLARISAITAIYTASGSAYTGSVPDSAAASDSGSPMIIVEGQAKWLRNERDACPLVPRVAFAFVDGQDSLGLLKGLRESFEIINRPWMLSSLVGSSGCSLVSSGSINSNNNNINSSISSIINIPAIKQSQLPSIEFAPITTHPSSSKNTTAAVPPPLPPCSPSALLSDLFEAKPWSSLPFPLAYSAYRMFCGERQWPPSSEIAFAKAMKGAGFCLKDGMGSVIREDALGEAGGEAEAEAEGKRSGWYWYHVQLKSA